METIRIQRDDHPARGSYVATIPGVPGIGRLFYRRERPGLLIAERTETSPSFKDKGIALALVTRMVEDARKDGAKIYALCTYIEEERRRHPEWTDVFVVSSPAGA